MKICLVVFISLLLVACGSTRKSGAYYQDDGPGSKNVNVESIPDAVPMPEPYFEAAFNPYTINGKRYVPLRSAVGFLEEGNASWYGKKYHGRKTSTGEVYDMYKMTAAHPTLPLPSYVRVTNAINKRSVIVRVNDRGPFIGNRIIDLSYVAAQKLGVVSAGTGRVIVEAISPQEQPLNTSPAQPISQNQFVQQPSQRPSVVAVGEIPAGEVATSGRDISSNDISDSANIPVVSSVSNSESSQVNASTQLLPQFKGDNTYQEQEQGQGQVYPAQTQQKPSSSISTQSLPTNTDFSQQLWLQVGAFSQMKNAQDLLQRLKASGYQNTKINQSANLFKVVVGPVNQQQLASTQQDLKFNGYPAFLAKP